MTSPQFHNRCCRRKLHSMLSYCRISLLVTQVVVLLNVFHHVITQSTVPSTSRVTKYTLFVYSFSIKSSIHTHSRFLCDPSLNLKNHCHYHHHGQNRKILHLLLGPPASSLRSTTARTCMNDPVDDSKESPSSTSSNSCTQSNDDHDKDNESSALINYHYTSNNNNNMNHGTENSVRKEHKEHGKNNANIKNDKHNKKQQQQKLSHDELKTKLIRQLHIVTKLVQSYHRQHQQQHHQNDKDNDNTKMSTSEGISKNELKLLYKFTTLERNVLNTIWSCQSISEIHDLLWDIVSFVKKMANINDTNFKKSRETTFKKDDDYDNYYYLSYDDFELLGPNIVSAFLRRIVDVHQLSQKQQRWQKKSAVMSTTNSSDSGSESGGNDMNGGKSRINTDDELLQKIVMHRYMPVLLNVMTHQFISSKDVSVKTPVLSSSTVSSFPSSKAFQPFNEWSSNLDKVYKHYLGKTETLNNSNNNNTTTATATAQRNKETIFDQQVTDYSSVNLLHSIGRIIRFSKGDYNGIEISFLFLHMNEIVDKIIQELVKYKSRVAEESYNINAANSSTSNSDPQIQYTVLRLAPKRLLEILVALATLVQYQSKYDKQHDYNDPNTKHMIPITISSSSTLPTIIKSGTLPSKSSPPLSTLIQLIGNRLHQGDAIGKFNGKDLSLGLWSLYVLRSIHYDMMKSFMRRLRKMRKSLSSNEICRSLWSIGQLIKILYEVEGRHLEIQQRQEEKNTLENQNDNSENLTLDPQFEEYENAWYERDPIELSQIVVGTDHSMNEIILSHEEAAIIIDQSKTCCYTLLHELNRDSTCSKNDVRVRNEEKLLHKQKLHILKVRQIADILYTCVVLDMDKDDRFLRALVTHLVQFDRFHYRVVDIARILWSMQRLNIKNQAETISTLIDHFTHFMLERREEATAPKSVITIIRSMVLILPNNGRSETRLLQALLPLLKSDTYLKRCNEFEVSNFIFILAMVDLYDKVALISLSSRMMEYEILDSITPSSASRFLWSLSKLILLEEDYEMDELLFEAFQALGGVLLSSQLTPVDASNAMWAIAKSSYSLDLGVFDHLAEILAKDEMLEQATIQQVCFGLWSCGKMINFEDPLREKMMHGEVTPPPYLLYATKYATFLVSVADQMTAKDIAQTIWSLGKLKITDRKILSVFAAKACEIASQRNFNSQELANCIWGLSKSDFDNETLILKLTSCMQNEEIVLQSTPQEAANVMYALGRMLIHDSKTFDMMNYVIMRNLDHATTQTIANALWAHDRLDLTPPQQLFDNWAKEKLDIIGLVINEDHSNEISENNT